MLDASAVLAVLLHEPGATDVAALLETQPCSMSTVNLVEVLTRLQELDTDVEWGIRALTRLGIRTLPFSSAEARIAAALQSLTKPLGLGLGDRACLATGALHEALVVTADRAWAELDVDIDVHLLG